MKNDSSAANGFAHKHTIIQMVLSTLLICGLVLPATTYVAGPFIVEIMASAMNQTINQQIAAQVTPVAAGMRVLIEAQIAELEDNISELQFKRDNGGGWTAHDAQELTTKLRRLRTQRAALRALTEDRNHQ